MSKGKQQLERVRHLMADERWRTVDQIRLITGDKQASISARLRDLRKPEFGGHVVERRSVPGTRGLFEFRVIKPEDKRLF